MKKLLTALLCLILCIGLLPAAYGAETAESAGRKTAPEGFSFVPGLIPETLEPEYPAPAALPQGTTLPASYSIRGRWTTPVKNQADNGLCWDFTACAIMETNLMKNGYGIHDLSEQHMAYATSDHSGNGLYGVNRAPTSGGNREIASAPTVLLTAYAVRGLDIGASYTIYDITPVSEQVSEGCFASALCS